MASTTVVFAASTTLMSYEGKGIRAKESVQTFELTKETKITIDHDQTISPSYAPRESVSSMTVILQKKELFSIVIQGILLKPMALADL